MPKTQTQSSIPRDESLVPQDETQQSVSGEDRQQRIARRAYELYEQRLREGREGDETSDWLSAEAEFRGQNDGSIASQAQGRS